MTQPTLIVNKNKENKNRKYERGTRARVQIDKWLMARSVHTIN